MRNKKLYSRDLIRIFTALGTVPNRISDKEDCTAGYFFLQKVHSTRGKLLKLSATKQSIALFTNENSSKNNKTELSEIHYTRIFMEKILIKLF